MPLAALGASGSGGAGLLGSYDSLVAGSLQGVTPVTYIFVLAAGLASSLSPCTLSVMPLTIGAPPHAFFSRFSELAHERAACSCKHRPQHSTDRRSVACMGGQKARQNCIDRSKNRKGCSQRDASHRNCRLHRRLRGAQRGQHVVGALTRPCIRVWRGHHADCAGSGVYQHWLSLRPNGLQRLAALWCAFASVHDATEAQQHAGCHCGCRRAMPV